MLPNLLPATIRAISVSLFTYGLGILSAFEGIAQDNARSYDVVVIGATPAGIAAAINAAHYGHTVLLAEEYAHVGRADDFGAVVYPILSLTRCWAALFWTILSGWRRTTLRSTGRVLSSTKLRTEASTPNRTSRWLSSGRCSASTIRLPPGQTFG